MSLLNFIGSNWGRLSDRTSIICKCITLYKYFSKTRGLVMDIKKEAA